MTFIDFSGGWSCENFLISLDLVIILTWQYIIDNMIVFTDKSKKDLARLKSWFIVDFVA